MKRLFIALLIGFAALLSGCGSSRSSTQPNATIVTGSASLSATAIPWTNVGGANPSFNYGHSSAGDGTAPIIIATPTAGAIITLNVTGSATVNGASHAPGDAGPTASTYPGNFISSPKIVVGAFTNSSGVVLNPGGPVSIGSSATLTVPAGVSQLQVGINSSANTFSANSGNFTLSWSISTSNPNQVYTVVVTPAQLTLNSGDFDSISAIVFLSINNAAPKAVSPQPAIKFFSSDARVTVSPAGEVCAGQWDSRYLTCTATTKIDPNTGLRVPDLPSGFVTVTAFDAAHNVQGTVQVSVHLRAARVTLSSNWGGLTCISQRLQAQYIASAVDANGNLILSCTDFPGTAGCIHDNDYTWRTESSSVALVNSFGSVVAGNPGVTNVFATLNGTVSEPLAFVTCPPVSIVLSTSPFTLNANPAPPFTTDDLLLSKGEQRYLNATLIDINGNTLVASPLTYIVSDPPAASLGTPINLSVRLTALTAGRFTVTAACEPPACNPSVADFISPASPLPQSAQAAGFGYPVYSNVIGATVQGINGSAVLVTGAVFASDGVTAARRLLIYDSESMALSRTVALGNVPNSLVVAPNGAKAYLGSCDGLVVVDLNSFQSSLQTFPVSGQPSTAVVTGKMLGVSPDGRYVVVSDNSCPSVPSNPASPPNHFVYLIDTTGTKTAARYNIANITSVTFAADGTNIWVGSNPPPGALDSNGLPDNGSVYVFKADTFVPIATNASTHVTSLAWMPDGQSYFASGDQLVDYRSCENQVIANIASPVSTVPGGLVATVPPVIEPFPEMSHLLGLDVNTWFDYSIANSAQVPTATVPTTPSDLVPAGTEGNVCVSTDFVYAPATTTGTLSCTSATQVSFAPKLQELFVTGLDDQTCASESSIHGYNALTHSVVDLPINPAVVPLSGGILSDGRKLFFGSYDVATRGAVLHRIDLATSTGAPGTLMEDNAVPVTVKPSFVAVVPK